MDIIHKDKNRILIGNHEDGWVTINLVLSNGHIGKLVMPAFFTKPLSEWLAKQKISKIEEEEE